MNIKPGMTNSVRKVGESVIKTYRQETVIKGLGKTALQRMLTEYYFSNFFSNSISIKPVRINLNKGETTFNYYDGVSLASLLSNDSLIPKKILSAACQIILTVKKNELETDKQYLKSYSEAFRDFTNRSNDILEEYGVNRGTLLKYNEDILEIFSESFNQQPETIIHGDYWFGNLLYNKDSEEMRLVDWEFADAGSIYVDLGTYYSYSLGFINGADLFLKNTKLQEYSVQLIRYFAFYRILRILSYVSLEDVQKTNVSNEYGLTYIIGVLKILLEDLESFKLDSGREIRESIDSRTKVAALLVTKDDEVLLLKRRSDDKFPDIWEPPGGRKEKGELMLDAIKRELEEETGLIFETGFKYFGESNFSIPGDTKSVNVVLFILRVNKQGIKITEHEKYGWFNLNEAIKLVEFDFIKQSLEKIRHD